MIIALSIYPFDPALALLVGLWSLVAGYWLFPVVVGHQHWMAWQQAVHARAQLPGGERGPAPREPNTHAVAMIIAEAVLAASALAVYVYGYSAWLYVLEAYAWAQGFFG